MHAGVVVAAAVPTIILTMGATTATEEEVVPTPTHYHILIGISLECHRVKGPAIRVNVIHGPSTECYRINSGN